MRLLLLLVLCLPACLGKAPAEQLLRLSPHPCADVARPLEATAAPSLDFRGLDSLPGLDRSAVLQRQGAVLTPSQRLFFEAPPAELLTQTLRQRLACDGGFRLHLPESVRGRPDLLVMGRVTAFELLQDGPAFAAEVWLRVYDGESRSLLAETILVERRPVESALPDAVAAAASRAAADIAGRAALWLHELAGERR